MAIFTIKEIQRRREVFQERMAKLAIDIAFVNTYNNVYYLSGVPLLSEWGRPMYLEPIRITGILGA